MWIVAKLIVMLLAFLMRPLAKKLKPEFASASESTVCDGVDCSILKHRNKGKTYATSFATELKCRFTFKLTLESDADRFFKSFGLATEIQSGDRIFDQKIYIACDSPVFAKQISANAEARRLILEFFQLGCEYVCCDGDMLWVRFEGDVSHRTEHLKPLVALIRQLSQLEMKGPRFQLDRFDERVLVVEGAIWALAAYAGTSFVYWLWDKKDLYLSRFVLVRPGLACGALLAVVLVIFTAIILKGSSKGHRIVIEAAIVLVLSLPAGGIGLLSDLNIALDKGPYVKIQREVLSKNRLVHRSSRGRTSYSYQLVFELAEGNGDLEFPGQMFVDLEAFQKAEVGAQANIEMGHGRLGYAWYRSITFSN